MSGLIIFPILIVYIVFAILMYKLTASKIVLIVILVFPFWDLIVQKGIKTYYQVFESEPIIYAMPEFDKDGKIESLGLGDVTISPVEYFNPKDAFENFKKHNKEIYNKVDEYIEFIVYIRKKIYEKKKIKAIRFNFSDKVPIKYEFIDKQQARYQLIVSKPISYGFHQKRYYKLIDTLHNDKILAESYAIKFATKMKDFRRNIMGWQSGINGKELLYVGGFNTVYKMLQKVLLLKSTPYNLNVFYDKGWENE